MTSTRLNPSQFTASTGTITKGNAGSINPASKLWKVGNIVILSLFVSSAGLLSSETIVANLQSGFRPGYTIRGAVGYAGSGTGVGSYFAITSEGAVFAAGARDSILINAVFIAG